jgi:hypothetical protein
MVDPPCPHLDWRGEHPDRPIVHLDDHPILQSMIKQFVEGPATGLLRLRSNNGQWTLMHTTAYRLELLDDTYTGLVCLRLPTPAELASHVTAV